MMKKRFFGGVLLIVRAQAGGAPGDARSLLCAEIPFSSW
jgi:hypothetical protein